MLKETLKETLKDMDSDEPKRLYQHVAAELKKQIAAGRYAIGDKLPAERYIAEDMNVSRTVVREGIIMLEVEGLVEVRKGSGIHVISQQIKTPADAGHDNEFMTLSAGPFEMLQARQLLESNIAEFAASQVTKSDIVQLMAIQEQARQEDRYRDSEWDKRFHIQVAQATQNSVLVTLVEKLWHQREQNPYWRKLHEHIDASSIDSWCEDHEQILKAVWGDTYGGENNYLWVHIAHLRQKIEDDPKQPRYIQTERGIGYRLVSE